MKYIILILTVFFFVACGKEEMSLYRGESYLYFKDDYRKDSLYYSFFFYPGHDYLEIPLHLVMSGEMISENRAFALTVDQKRTTAGVNDYVLPETCEWRKGVLEDSTSYRIKLMKSPCLDNDTLCVVLDLQGDQNFSAGPVFQRKLKIYFSSVKSRPAWWTKDVTDLYLGEYSDEKMELFLEIVGTGDLDGLSLNEIRPYALTFKYELMKRADQGDKEAEAILNTLTVIG